MARGIADDEPQFQELTGADLAAARAEYRRVWGEDMPAADTALSHPPVKPTHRTRTRRR